MLRLWSIVRLLTACCPVLLALMQYYCSQMAMGSIILACGACALNNACPCQALRPTVSARLRTARESLTGPPARAWEAARAAQAMGSRAQAMTAALAPAPALALAQALVVVWAPISQASCATLALTCCRQRLCCCLQSTQICTSGRLPACGQGMKTWQWL